jgi:hypothetical protein
VAAVELSELYTEQFGLHGRAFDKLRQELANIRVHYVAGAQVRQHNVFEIDEGVRVSGKYFHLHGFKETDRVYEQIFKELEQFAVRK